MNKRFLDDLAAMVIVFSGGILLLMNGWLTVVLDGETVLSALTKVSLALAASVLVGLLAIWGVWEDSLYSLRHQRLVLILGLCLWAVACQARASWCEHDEIDSLIVLSAPLVIAIIPWFFDDFLSATVSVIATTGIALLVAEEFNSPAAICTAIAAGIVTLLALQKKQHFGEKANLRPQICVAIFSLIFLAVLLGAIDFSKISEAKRPLFWMTEEEQQHAIHTALAGSKLFGKADCELNLEFALDGQAITYMIARFGWIAGIQTLFVLAAVLSALVWLAVRNGDALACGVTALMVVQIVGYLSMGFGADWMLAPTTLPLLSGGVWSTMAWSVLTTLVLFPPEVINEL